MKQLLLAGSLFLFVAFIGGCSKPVKDPEKETGFIEYLIPKGEHYSSNNTIQLVSGTGLHFKVKFDSSCIYTTISSENAGDINKLYGFSDCSTQHQENSARVGWVWNGKALELHAYCYANSVRKSKLLGTIAIGEIKELAIGISGNQYVFIYDGVVTTMDRYCSSASITGYQLYPYFGGDEVAPHDVRIYIKPL